LNKERTDRIVRKIVIDNPGITPDEVYKQFLIELFTEDIRNGQPIEELILTDFNPKNEGQMQKILELVEEGYMIATEKETLYKVNPTYYNKIRNNGLKR